MKFDREGKEDREREGGDRERKTNRQTDRQTETNRETDGGEQREWYI